MAAEPIAVKPGSPCIAYMLAHLRRGPYYAGIAPDLWTLEARVSMLMYQRSQSSGMDHYDPALPVWLETHVDEQAARERIAQIQGWPLRWQRRLIESANPDWLNVCDVALRIHEDFSHAVPETLPCPPRVQPRPPRDPIHH